MIVGARARRVALVLLALCLHAALAGATHFHRIGRGLPLSSPGRAAIRDEAAHATPESAGHTQCLLCRLQRNLASGLCNAGPAMTEPPPAALRLDTLPLGASHSPLPGVAQGRAPPTHA